MPIAISTLTALATYCIACFGLSYILGRSKVTLWLRTEVHALGFVGRKLVELTECPACSGFWMGLAWSLWHGVGPPAAIGWGLFTSGSNLLLAVATKMMDFTAEDT